MTQLGIGDNCHFSKPKKSYKWNGSYFEAMCLVAEYALDPAEQAEAQREVNRMVDAMNDAEQEERMKNQESLIEYLNVEVGNLFDGIHFQSTGALTQLSVRSHLNGVMQNLMNERHIQDYLVVCDDSNNPPSVINRNELVVDVAFKDEFGKLFRVPYRKTGLVAATSPIGGSGQNMISPQGNLNTTGAASIVTTTINASTAAGSYSYAVNSMRANEATISKATQSSSADLPKFMFVDQDENGIQFKLTLEPEAAISSSEALKLSMMLHAKMMNPTAFSILAYVKKNNLERHFKFEHA